MLPRHFTDPRGGGQPWTHRDPNTHGPRDAVPGQVSGKPGAHSPSRNACEWPGTLGLSVRSQVLPLVLQRPESLSSCPPSASTVISNSPGNWEASQAARLRWGINNLQILKKKLGAIFTRKMLSMKMQSV